MKKITITLDEQSIDNAIKELRRYQSELGDKTNRLVQKLVDLGVEFALQEVVSLGAFDSGELAVSIDGLMYTDGTHGIIFTDCGHAAFVEFGTGITGAESPHPSMPWQYDINNHGEAGWVYYNEKTGKFGWTKGMPSRPFMYNTAKHLQDELEQIAKEVWKS